MADRLSYLKIVQYPKEIISISAFHSWKKNPVTRAMFKDMVIAVFEQLDTPLPLSFEQTVTMTHQREGAMAVIDEILRWEPESVTAAKNKAQQEGKPVEEDDEN